MNKTILSSIAFAVAAAHSLSANIFITEFFYQGQGGSPGNEHEFVELTNVGTSTIDVTGWYYRDSTGNPATPFSLSGFSSIASGESVIFTDISEADFRTVWPDLDPSVRVLGNAVPGLGRNDSVRIFDSEDGLVDQLDYGDEDFNGSERWRFITGITTPENLGQNDILGWYFSDTQDGLVNLTSINGDIGNPGYANFTVIPEPSTYALIFGLIGAVLIIRRRR